MACSLEACSIFKACDLAESIVGGGESPIPRPALTQKLHELSLTKEVLKRVAEVCDGPNEEGRCSQATLIHETRSFMFGSPAIPLMTQPIETGPTAGFGN